MLCAQWRQHTNISPSLCVWTDAGAGAEAAGGRTESRERGDPGNRGGGGGLTSAGEVTVGLSCPFPWIHMDTVITLMSFQGQGKPAVMVRTFEQSKVHEAFYGHEGVFG